jgi:hypothetical protein
MERDKIKRGMNDSGSRNRPFSDSSWEINYLCHDPLIVIMYGPFKRLFRGLYLGAVLSRRVLYEWEIKREILACDRGQLNLRPSRISRYFLSVLRLLSLTTMTAIPDDKLFEYSHRVKDKVVVITGRYTV